MRTATPGEPTGVGTPHRRCGVGEVPRSSPPSSLATGATNAAMSSGGADDRRQVQRCDVGPGAIIPQEGLTTTTHPRPTGRNDGTATCAGVLRSRMPPQHRVTTSATARLNVRAATRDDQRLGALDRRSVGVQLRHPIEMRRSAGGPLPTFERPGVPSSSPARQSSPAPTGFPTRCRSGSAPSRPGMACPVTPDRLDHCPASPTAAGGDGGRDPCAWLHWSSGATTSDTRPIRIAVSALTRSSLPISAMRKSHPIRSCASTPPAPAQTSPALTGVEERHPTSRSPRRPTLTK